MLKQVFLIAAAALLFTAGCQSSAKAPATSMDMPSRAVVVSAGQGQLTTVFLPPAAGSTEPIVMSSSGGEVCPECKAAAAKYFATGVLDPKCSMTGATRMAVTAPVRTGQGSH